MPTNPRPNNASNPSPARAREVTIDYRNVPVGALRAVTLTNPRTGREMATAIQVDGAAYTPTKRFWRSLFQRFGLNEQVFRYFKYEEVFARVVSMNPDARLRICVEQTPAAEAASDDNPLARRRLLAVSNPRRPVLGYDDAITLLRRHTGDGNASGGGGVSYHDGVINSVHVPRSGEHGFDIGPDRFHNRFVVEVPVDGFGDPRIFLSLLRQVCSNGAVGYSRAFRSDVRVGNNDAAYTLERALGQFDHDEGFAALRQRFESAQKSWASLRETVALHQVLGRISGRRHDFDLTGSGDDTAPRGHGVRLQAELNKVAGDRHALYGLANLDALSSKRQRVLPAKCRVYDLINFASEVATHRAGPDSRYRLQAFIGTLISDEYDLEGTAERVPEFKDLFANVN